MYNKFQLPCHYEIYTPFINFSNSQSATTSLNSDWLLQKLSFFTVARLFDIDLGVTLHPNTENFPQNIRLEPDYVY